MKSGALEIGIRELRDGLSKHLARVRAGETIVVTDHGTAVARLVPLQGERAIDRLVHAGVVTPAGSRSRSVPRPVQAHGSVSDLVAEQRG